MTDEAGRVTAAFSSLNGELPEAKGVRLISAAEAEQLVRDHLADQRAADTVIPEMTGRILLSPDEEDEAEEGYPDHLVWMVFSHLGAAFKVIGRVLFYLSTFIAGLVIAYILSPLTQFFNRTIFRRMKRRKRCASSATHITSPSAKARWIRC